MKISFQTGSFTWPALFYSLLITYDWIAYAGGAPPVFDTSIGITTLQGISVAGRVSLFYQAAGVFIICLLAFHQTASYGYRLFESSAAELRVITFTSQAGLFFLLFKVFGSQLYPDLMLVHSLHLLAAAGLMGGKYLRKPTLDAEHYGWLAVIALCLWFTLADFAALMRTGIKLSYPWFLTVTGTAAMLAVSLRPHISEKIPLLMSSLRPLALLPVLSVAKDEIYLAINSRGWYSTPFTPGVMLATGAAILLLAAAWNFRRRKTCEDPVGRKWLPWIIAGLALKSGYMLQVTTAADMFELANRVLPLQQFVQFGRIPLLETFNSHLLSDIFTPVIYTLVNGYHGLDMLAWDYLLPAAYAVVIYFILWKLTGSKWAALFAAVFVPFTQVLIPDYFTLSLATLFLLKKVLDDWNWKNCLSLSAWCWFLFAWRIDLGFANLAAVAGILLVYGSRSGGATGNWLRASLAFLAVFVLPLTAALIFSGTDPVLQAWHYLNGSQAYGVPQLVLAWGHISILHYFIFPALTLLSGLWLILETKPREGNPFTVLLILFMVIFYLANFQRGLVRHTLVTQNDIFTSSFAFFIFSAAVYLVFQPGSAKGFFAFTAVSSLLVLTLKLPRFDGASTFFGSALYFHTVQPPIQPAGHRIARSQDGNKVSEELTGYLKRLNNSTFIDFTNEPMLYYYSGKQHPGYFSQNLLSAHDAFLQDKYIESLRSPDVPVVLFANRKKSWGDEVDGIPNAVRHYKIAEHIYRKYSPAGFIGGKETWLANDHPESGDSAALRSEVFRLGMLPFAWGSAGGGGHLIARLMEKPSMLDDKAQTFPLRPKIEKASGNFVELILDNAGSDKPAWLSFGAGLNEYGSFEFTIKAGTHQRYLVRVSTQGAWYRSEVDWVRLQVNNGEIRLMSVNLLKAD